jgi:hypothetical protein
MMGDPEKTDPHKAVPCEVTSSEGHLTAEEMIAAIVGKQKSRAAEQQKSEAPKPTSDVKPKPSPKPALKVVRHVEPAIFDAKDLTRVPGIVGRMIDWIEAASLYPNRPLALGTSLVTVGTLIGQRVAGPTQGSSHLYVVGISSSGSGKQLCIDCGKEALSAIGALERIGPGDFRSSVALVNALKVQSVFCSYIDEYGLVLQRIGDKRGGGYEYDVLSILQQLWGHNWAYYNTPASAREKSKRIFAPAFSILGLSVPEQFYGAVTFKQIAGGLLNRHLIIRGRDRPPKQSRAHGSWRLTDQLKAELKEFYRPRQKPSAKDILEKNMEAMDDWSFDPDVTMSWGVGAEQIWTDLANELREERDELKCNLFARVPEMTVRIATIVAFGRYSPTVDELDMKLARALAMKSAETLHDGVLKYTVDPQGFAALCQKVIDFAAASSEKHQPSESSVSLNFISIRDLKRKSTVLMGKGGDLDAVTKHLCEAERLRFVIRQNPKGGQPSPGYVLCE